ncbi:predicted protein [Histoplasma capsulatum H143]|uniref:Uncharacterized protein n=1 Tax=Ajellomyces capsulatus (strain H143) TaxID=544712 RepID=C6HNC7_AJECH|nr:predicted protein [Histoplasma capsulatum H143]
MKRRVFLQSGGGGGGGGDGDGEERTRYCPLFSPRSFAEWINITDTTDKYTLNEHLELVLKPLENMLEIYREYTGNMLHVVGVSSPSQVQSAAAGGLQGPKGAVQPMCLPSVVGQKPSSGRVSNLVQPPSATAGA